MEKGEEIVKKLRKNNLYLLNYQVWVNGIREEFSQMKKNN